MIDFLRSHILRFALVSACLISQAGCHGTLHKKWADREVYGILKKKGSSVPNAGQGLLNIEPNAPPNLDQLAKNMTTVEFLGDRADIEKNAKILTLADALGLAVTHNRTYQGQKENVYLAALDLTLARHEFAPIFSASGSGEHVERNVQTAVNGFVKEHTLTSTGGVGFSALSSIGTRLAADLSTDFVRFFTGGMRDVSDSRLAITLSQPLLRGAGALTVTEPLTQAERDVLYSIRDFTQYRKTFAIDTVTQYYTTLRSRSEARNAYLVYTSFKKILVAQSALVDANRSGRTKSSLGLLNQAELNYRRRWINAVRAYEENLDSLKITLAIPVTQPILLDQKELDKLELIHPPGTVDEAMETALATRLDLWNARDALEDAHRHVRVAERDLLPGLGIKADYQITGDPNRGGLNVDAKRRVASVGLDVDLHLDQKPSRNTLRSTQIARQRAERSLTLAEDTVRQDVRSSWRALDVARKQFDLAQEAMKLGEARMELEQALYEADRGSSRDLIDAQQALIDARDQITAMLINHTIARLDLWKDMGVLFIRKDGGWMDVLAKEAPKGDDL